MSNKAKIFGILIIFIAFLIVSFNSLSITSPNILDTDASTYIIVVMLMIFVFICFAAKNDLDFDYKAKNILYATVVFLVYFALLSFLRVSLSFAFLSYRVDALLFPLPLLGLIILVFGTSGAKKLLPLIVYAVFASPLLLLPLLQLNGAFANANAVLVFDLLKAVGAPVSRIGLMITAISGSSITISTTCVSIGTFVALVMFLIPVAYLYEGDKVLRIYWVISAFFLMLILNVLRMLFIALIWAFFGLNSAVNTFHAFAGQFIFYGVIIIMVLIAGKYGMSLRSLQKEEEKTKKQKSRSRRTGVDLRLVVPVIMALIFAVIGFALNYGYGSMVYAPAVLFGGNVTQAASSQLILASLGNAHNNMVVLSSTPIGQLFALTNQTNFNDSIFVVTNVSYAPGSKNNLQNYTPVSAAQSYLLKNGITLTAQTVTSNNVLFEINYFSLPYNASGNWLTINYAMFHLVNNTSIPSCQINYQSIGTTQYYDTLFYNLITARTTAITNKGVMCQSYLVASSR